jgi:hypothetical protein
MLAFIWSLGRPTVDLGDVALVKFHLEDASIDPLRKNKRVTDPANGFEYRLWLCGFIEVSLLTSSQKVVSSLNYPRSGSAGPTLPRRRQKMAIRN